MKAKLTKLALHDGYRLDDENGLCIASTLESLSFKNCQAIERGYDLDELANKEYLDGYDSTKFCRLAFKDGFQKALELMGDKKFTEEDMFRMFTYGHALTNAIKLKVIQDKPFGEIFNDFIQSLQQTEWDVIVEMEGFVDEEGIYCGERPKLDADGCLILKLKSE